MRADSTRMIERLRALSSDFGDNFFFEVANHIGILEEERTLAMRHKQRAYTTAKKIKKAARKAGVRI